MRIRKKSAQPREPRRVFGLLNVHHWIAIPIYLRDLERDFLERDFDFLERERDFDFLGASADLLRLRAAPSIPAPYAHPPLRLFLCLLPPVGIANVRSIGHLPVVYVAPQKEQKKYLI
jgi:hypothetical protein